MALTTLNLEENSNTQPLSREDGLDYSHGKFDWIFGVILPVICVAADPIVFRLSGAMLYEYKPFAYALSFVSIMALMAFMLFGKKAWRVQCCFKRTLCIRCIGLLGSRDHSRAF